MSETLRPGFQAAPKYWAFISYSHRDEAWARWLRHALETRVAVQRALGHLVMALGDAAAARASSNWTFEAAEMLIGLSAVAAPAPVR